MKEDSNKKQYISITKWIMLISIGFLIIAGNYLLVKHYQNAWAETEISEKNQLNEKSENEQEILKELQEQNSSQIEKTIQKLQPKLDPEITEKISKSIIKNAKKYNIPESLIISIINRESSFNPIAVSKSNCIGLMQINPKAHKELLGKMELDYYSACYIDNNIKLGCIIFSQYYAEKKTLKDALERYLGASSDKYYQDILELFTQIEIEKLKTTKEGENAKSKEESNDEK